MRLPAITIAVLEDIERGREGDFLTIRQLRLTARFPSGQESEPFTYSVLRRKALDSVVIVAHFRGERGERRVYLRSALRPPVALRDQAPQLSPELWEVPAGLVEPGEEPRAAAARELAEELGFDGLEAKLAPLGPWGLPAPGFVGERHLFFHVEVDPERRGVPPEDGSPLEREAAIVDLPLEEALRLAREGGLPDEKTELALRRLAELAP